MRRALFLLSVVTAATAISGAADARLRVPTEVTFETFCGGGFCDFQFGDDWIYAGEVDSQVRACRVNRKVKLFERIKGDDILRGADWSDSRGHWFVRRPDYDSVTGTYYAFAPKKRLRSGDVCAPDRSNVLQD